MRSFWRESCETGAVQQGSRDPMSQTGQCSRPARARSGHWLVCCAMCHCKTTAPSMINTSFAGLALPPLRLAAPRCCAVFPRPRWPRYQTRRPSPWCGSCHRLACRAWITVDGWRATSCCCVCCRYNGSGACMVVLFSLQQPLMATEFASPTDSSGCYEVPRVRREEIRVQGLGNAHACSWTPFMSAASPVCHSASLPHACMLQSSTPVFRQRPPPPSPHTHICNMCVCVIPSHRPIPTCLSHHTGPCGRACSTGWR